LSFRSRGEPRLEQEVDELGHTQAVPTPVTEQEPVTEAVPEADKPFRVRRIAKIALRDDGRLRLVKFPQED
jgi:hypothetical protein